MLFLGFQFDRDVFRSESLSLGLLFTWGLFNRLLFDYVCFSNVSHFFLEILLAFVLSTPYYYSYDYGRYSCETQDYRKNQDFCRDCLLCNWLCCIVWRRSYLVRRMRISAIRMRSIGLRTVIPSRVWYWVNNNVCRRSITRLRIRLGN